MKKPVKTSQHSLMARLTHIANRSGRPFNEVLQYYAIERFLARLSRSPHSTHFVLKGGLIFYARRLPLRRPTRDIDLQADSSSTISDIERILREICSQAVEPDGITFDPRSVAVEHLINRADPQGVGAKCVASLGTAQVTLRLDISYANVITPSEVELPYPTLFDTPEPQLRAYPYETVIAEKLQAVVFLGRINDRLKDFYDLWLLSDQSDFDGQTLAAAIQATFLNRKTAIPTDVPVALTPAFADARQRQWLTFLGKQGGDTAQVADFASVLDRLRRFLLPPLNAAGRAAPFAAAWKAGGDWQP